VGSAWVEERRSQSLTVAVRTHVYALKEISLPDYPRLLNLDDDTRDKLISYLNEELVRHYAERQQWLQDVINWERDYWAKPSQERRTFPFTGASNIIIPLDAIAVETIHARDMTTLFALDQFVAGKAKNPAWSNHAHPVERAMDHIILKDIKAYWPFNSINLERVKFGTAVGKSGYEKIKKTAVRSVGDIEEEFDVVVKDGPTIEAVPVSRFLMPFTSQDPQTAPWVGEEHSWTPYEVKLLTESGMFYPDTVEKLEGWVAQSSVGPESERKADKKQEEI